MTDFALLVSCMTSPSLACVLGLLLTATAVDAQFSGTIKVIKRNHIIGEPVVVRVSLTNYTGMEQVLQGNRMPWISFMVESSSGNPVIARQADAPGPIRIAPGQSLAKDFDLSSQFQLNEPGNYSVSAVIRPNDESIHGATTQRAYFQLSEGRLYWSQRVGNVGPNSSTRDFRILQFRSDTATQLFVQIKDEQTGRTIRTAPLGQVLMLRKPIMAIDGERHLNVLFLTSPKTFLHYRISPDGKILSRDMHRRAVTGDPKLTVMGDGRVVVRNSILYDPVAEAKMRANIRNITDRP